MGVRISGSAIGIGCAAYVVVLRAGANLLAVGHCFAWHVTCPAVDVSISSSSMVFQ